MKFIINAAISISFIFSSQVFAHQICTDIPGSNVYTVDEVNPPADAPQESIDAGIYVQVKKCQATTPQANHCLTDKKPTSTEMAILAPDGLACSDYGTYHFNAIAQIAERAKTSILKFYILGFVSLPVMGLPMILVAASDRLLDTHIVFTAQDGKAAKNVKNAFTRDVEIHNFDFEEFEEKLAVALAAAKTLEKDPEAIKEVKDSNGNPVPTPGSDAVRPSGDTF